MLKQAAKIPHVSGIELVGTWDVRPDNAAQMKQALSDLGLTCVSRMAVDGLVPVPRGRRAGDRKEHPVVVQIRLRSKILNKFTHLGLSQFVWN